MAQQVRVEAFADTGFLRDRAHDLTDPLPRVNPDMAILALLSADKQRPDPAFTDMHGQ
jgi:hypothetical protein